MIKINYPTVKLGAFHKDYIKTLDIAADVAKSYKSFMARPEFAALVTQYNFDLDNILTANFADLLEMSTALNKPYNTTKSAKDKKKVELKKLALILDYDVKNKRQPKIANFFKKNATLLNLRTCYFCNIDYINVFDDIGDYHDGLDFVKTATARELKTIKGIGDVAAAKVLGQRGRINSIDELNIRPTQKENLKQLEVNDKHSHFTLDHVLAKSTHPLVALSLYNFVPACYACNCKFKGAAQLVKTADDQDLSPTSADFSVDQNVRFKLFFKQSALQKPLLNVKDFTVQLDASINESKYRKYIETFKLNSRYTFHKEEAAELINKHNNYSQSRIEEIARNLKMTVQDVKLDLFGKSLFSGNPESSSLTKYKRDIAKNIGVKGVK